MTTRQPHKANRKIYDVNENGIFVATDANIKEAVARYLRKNVDELPPIGQWDVSNVTNMEGVFEGKRKFNEDISNWNVSNVTNMSRMFREAESFNIDISRWDVSNVKNMSNMFSRFTKFRQPLNSWNTSNVESMYGMFSQTFYNQPLNDWNVSNVKDMGYMFFGNSLFNQPLNNWNVSNVESMERMFEGASNFNQDLSMWNLNPDVYLGNMFREASRMNPAFKPSKEAAIKRQKEAIKQEAKTLAYEILPAEKSATKLTPRIPPTPGNKILEYVGLTEKPAYDMAIKGEKSYVAEQKKLEKEKAKAIKMASKMVSKPVKLSNIEEISEVTSLGGKKKRRTKRKRTTKRNTKRHKY